MEEKRSIFSYISQMFATYGAIVVMFIVFNLILDESTGQYSTLFELAGKGITLVTLLELLLLSVVVTVAQIVFLTDAVFKDLSMILRNVFFFAAILTVIVAFACMFGWFPIDDAKAWAGFGVSFALSMAASILITRFVEKAENARMQEALEKYNREMHDGDR
ncbi:MAG: hypothetical protein K5871_10240 [Lachnospiraceae bacterium]|nr:hypothetical protein [Lachnospiraceae bacterium]